MNWLRRKINMLLFREESLESDEDFERKLKKTEGLDQNRFQRAIETVETILLEANDQRQVAAIYDMVIWNLGKSVATDGSIGLFTGAYVIDNSRISYGFFTGMPEADLGMTTIDLTKCNVYTGCWSFDRIVASFDSTFANGYKQPSDSNGVYYPELRLAIMLNGRHHSSWATYLETGRVKLRAISLRPFFEIAHTDGAFFYFKNEYGEEEKLRTADYRMAVLFQLAKERSKIDLPNTRDAFHQKAVDDLSPSQ